MSTSQLIRESPSSDRGEEIAVELGTGADVVSDLPRVIAQVNTNAGQFRGWGPRVLI